MDNGIGQRIKQRRKELHITQTQIGEKTSVSSGNLSCIENGKYLPSAVALIELSKILDCTADYILFGKSEISEMDKLALSENEKELLELFNQLPEREQIKAIARMEDIVEKYKEK